MSLGNSKNKQEVQKYFEEAKETNSIILGWGGDIDFSMCSSKEDVVKVWENSNLTELSSGSMVNAFKNKMKVGDLVIISDGNYKFKAIAEVTGEYYFDEQSDFHRKDLLSGFKYLVNHVLHWI